MPQEFSRISKLSCCEKNMVLNDMLEKLHCLKLGYNGGVWLECLRWAFVYRGRRGTCFDSVCAKPGGLACRRLERCFIHTSDVLSLSFAHMSHSHSFSDMRRSSWNPDFERSANSEQEVSLCLPLMFHATRSNLISSCQLYLSTQ